jgi:Ser/Thr protein kinase RdoA (MazF antagonist)
MRACTNQPSHRKPITQASHRATEAVKPPTAAAPLCVVLQVCRGLAALESCRPLVLHRDVKPSNVFIDAAGVARLGDFGLSRAMPDNRYSMGE